MAQQFLLNATATIPDTPRSAMSLEGLVKYPIPWTRFRKDDAYDTVLPGTATGRYLGLVGGAFASASPSLQTSDLHSAGATTQYGRFTFSLPPEYNPGDTVRVQFHCGMLGHVADVTATILAAVYKSDREAGIGSNLIAASASSMNSVSLADVAFTVTPTGLAVGDTLDIRVAIAVNDAATGSSVKAVIGEAAMLLNIKG